METFWFNIFSSKQVLGELSLPKRYYMSQIIISYNRNSFIDGQVISCDNKYFPIKIFTNNNATMHMHESSKISCMSQITSAQNLVIFRNFMIVQYP